MDELVLVGIVPRLSDWEILKREFWYRIPVKSAPDIAEKVHYLAFYQPKIFGDEKYSVNYYAKIRDLKVVKRIELLPDEPKHPRADKDYYKYTLENLEKLPHPILSKRWRRIVFIPTTLKKLKQAEEINDLYHTSPIEEEMYTHFRKENIQVERQLFVNEGRKIYCLDFGILCKEGKIDVECDGSAYHSSKKDVAKDRDRNNELTSYGWSVLRFTGSEIIQNPEECIKKVKRTIETLNGVDNKAKKLK